MPDARSTHPAQGSETVRDRVAQPPLRQIARALLDLRPRGEWLLDGAAGRELGYELLLEMIWRHPRRATLAGLSETTAIPLADVFRAITALARRGMIEFESHAPLLREHHVGLSEPARLHVEQYLRDAATSLRALFEEPEEETQ